MPSDSDPPYDFCSDEWVVHEPHVPDGPEFADLAAALETAVQAAQALATTRNAEIRALNEERLRLAKEARDRPIRALDLFIETKGTPTQKAKRKDGFLTDTEGFLLVERDLYAPFSNYTSFDEREAKRAFRSFSPAFSLTDAQYDALSAIRDAAIAIDPKAVLEPITAAAAAVGANPPASPPPSIFVRLTL